MCASADRSRRVGRGRPAPSQQRDRLRSLDSSRYALIGGRNRSRLGSTPCKWLGAALGVPTVSCGRGHSARATGVMSALAQQRHRCIVVPQPCSAPGSPRSRSPAAWAKWPAVMRWATLSTPSASCGTNPLISKATIRTRNIRPLLSLMAVAPWRFRDRTRCRPWATRAASVASRR